MEEIEYVKLSTENFCMNSLDNFKRYQKVTRCWRKHNDTYTLTPVSYTENWSLLELREVAEKILKALCSGNAAFGAVCVGEIIGFALIERESFGSENQYVDLAEFYVSAPFQRKGIGKKLFGLSCGAAKDFGAKKLYISAHSAKESIAAYRSYGCVSALEINRVLAEKEPCDLQLEFDLYK